MYLQELHRCAASTGGVFPYPQHCDGLYALLYPPKSNRDAERGNTDSMVVEDQNSTCAVILAGDSAHAFAPDLGQVNNIFGACALFIMVFAHCTLLHTCVNRV